MNHGDIIRRIKDAGFEAYVVGGAVRDTLLKVEPKDWDVATNAKYNQLRRIFADRETDEVGRSFQVLVVDGVEVATYRMDEYDADGLPIGAVAVSTIEDDLARRDLTINSMAMDVDTGKIIDPHGGGDDLRNGIIRFTGDQAARITEDPLRMLRACRFLAILGRFRFARETMLYMTELAHELERVPMERIGIETMKAMRAGSAGNYFRALANTSLLGWVFPTMLDSVNHVGGEFHGETVFEHACYCCDNIPVDNPTLKLAAFLHDIGKPMAYRLHSNGSFKGHAKWGAEIADAELRRLGFSVATRRRVTTLIKEHMTNITNSISKRSIRRLLIRLGDVPFRELITLAMADHDANLKNEKHPPGTFDHYALKFTETVEEGNAMSMGDLAVNGHDVMRILDIGRGKAVGATLRRLFDAVVDDPKINDRDILLKMIKGD